MPTSSTASTSSTSRPTSSPNAASPSICASAFARSVGLETAPPEYFYTDARWQQLLAVRDTDASVLDHDGAHKLAFADKKFGTVGAVALDSHGNPTRVKVRVEQAEN